MSALPEQSIESPSGSEAAGQENIYFRFNASPLWEWQAELLQGSVRMPDETASPLMAEQYADLILAYWRDLSEAGALDAEEPLYIMELWSGSGRFAFYLLNALSGKLTALNRPGWKPVYILSDPGPLNLDFCKLHPKLSPYFAKGKADLLHWNGLDPDDGLYLQYSSRLFNRHNIKNPVAVIANFVHGRMRQDLFHIHYGKLCEIRMAMNFQAQEDESGSGIAHAGQNSIESVHFDYKIGEAIEPDQIAEKWRQALQEYVDRLDDTTLLFPFEALECLECLRALCNDRFLLLGADRGIFREKDLRLQSRPDIRFDGLWSLPVNYHAIARYVQERKSRIRFSQNQDEGLVFSVMTFNGTENEHMSIDRIFNEQMIRFNPEDYHVLKNMWAENRIAQTPAQMAVCLRLSYWDPDLLQLFLRRLLDQRPSFTPLERLMWIEILWAIWEWHYPITGPDEMSFDMGLLAMDLGAWGLGIDCYEMSLDLFGPEPAGLHNLALCYFQSGQISQCKETLKEAGSMDPESEQTRVLLLEINQVQEQWQRLPWYRPDLCAEGGFCLQPLGKQHIAALLYQYRDPNIGVMTRLPELKTEADAERFIQEEYSDKHKAIFAVMHAAHGFIGVVSLSCREPIGYFYFWIGVDYQGLGFGQQAVKILLERIAPNLGVHTVYTSAYQDNLRSKNSLKALGFELLSFRALEPDQDIVFFMKHNNGQAANLQTAYGDLMRLLTEVNSSFLLAAWPE